MLTPQIRHLKIHATKSFPQWFASSRRKRAHERRLVINILQLQPPKSKKTTSACIRLNLVMAAEAELPHSLITDKRMC